MFILKRKKRAVMYMTASNGYVFYLSDIRLSALWLKMIRLRMEKNFVITFYFLRLINIPILVAT